MALLTRIRTRNYRSLADVTVEVGGVTVLFGPNGSGKSTFLDTLWFLRDCAINGVDKAAERRNHGIGMLWDGAEENAPIELTIHTEHGQYEVQCALGGGRIDPLVGEHLSAEGGLPLISRDPGSARVQFDAPSGEAGKTLTLREPNKLALSRYLDYFPRVSAAVEVERLSYVTRWHHSRSFRWWSLKTRGSEAGAGYDLVEDGRNLWSVLRNLQGRGSVDGRFDTIVRYMRESFPGFRELVFDPIGPSAVYCSMIDAQRRSPIAASGMSDGHLQMLLLLTALFSGDPTRPLLLLLDEPETSLHPWPIAVLARAIEQVCRDRGYQVILATHSPVLLSQFAPEDILVASLVDGRTQLQRVHQLEGIRDLLDQYAIGSLYMAEAVAAQSDPGGEHG